MRMTELPLDGCLLRPWRGGDESSLARHANSRRIWLNLNDRFPHPYTLADARAWIRTAAAETPTTKFAIAVDGAAVGGIGFEPGKDVFRRTAEIGYWLGEEFWGRGIATQALRAVTEHIFSHFDVSRIHAHVFEWNPASMRVLEKAGYECEGRERASVTKDGRTIDSLRYAVVRP